MSKKPRQNYGQGLIHCKLVEAPSNFIFGRPKAALLFCLRLIVLFFPFFFLARLIAVLSIVSVYLAYDSSIVTTCPSIPAARFTFCLSLILFVFLFVVVFLVIHVEPRARVGRPQTSLSTTPPPPSNFIAGRLKTDLRFWFFGNSRCGVPLFIVIFVIHKYKNM